MRLALFQPDIPQNTGTILRTAACLDLAVDIIRPAGFDISDKALRRAVMDYREGLDVSRHDSWEAFRQAKLAQTRIVALTTKSDLSFTSFSFSDTDVLLLGRETSGLPDHVHEMCDARVTIPMAMGRRSLNVAVAAAMVAGEALRQVGYFESAAR